MGSQSDEALVEDLARAFYSRHPMKAISPALAELCSVSLNEPIPFDILEEKGGSHAGLRAIIRAGLPIITAREASARAEGRREGIEEAADKASAFDDEAKDNPYSEAARVIAAAIRALAEKQP